MESLIQTPRRPGSAFAITLFALIAIVGLYYVKWSPYYHRAFVAADTHSIGHSILAGTEPMPPQASWPAALGYATAYAKAIWQALVLGLLLGSAVQALLPAHWVARLLGSAGMRSVAAGGLLALPGMMCTCCAAPVVVGLRARQASPGAAVAFWLGNSVLNPATLVFMGFVLGWHWTALRLTLGALLVFGGGWLVNRQATPAERSAAREQLEALAAEASLQGSRFAQWLKLLARMTLRLVPEYAVLVLLLGAARAWLFPHVGPEVDNAIWWILAFAIAGTLFVIPTAAEVPIVQAMLSFGVAAGPAAALLMTLPPISVPSLAMTARALGVRVQATLVLMVVAAGVVAGLAAVALHF
ncbi:permease [Trinickia violacea]|uniref:Permease n=1 Tax=Trinickia violacea TaxID=2571746 RepID=A0A4P8J2B6_9BURK|nr:permease [Trinickia violacea]QCP53894.1 permease [Trinickia violacea]